MKRRKGFFVREKGDVKFSTEAKKEKGQTSFMGGGGGERDP